MHSNRKSVIAGILSATFVMLGIALFLTRYLSVHPPGDLHIPAFILGLGILLFFAALLLWKQPRDAESFKRPYL